MTPKTDYKDVLQGCIGDFLSDWKSGYKINEDLPAVAEFLTEEIIKALKEFDYIIIHDYLIRKSII